MVTNAHRPPLGRCPRLTNRHSQAREGPVPSLPPRLPPRGASVRAEEAGGGGGRAAASSSLQRVVSRRARRDQGEAKGLGRMASLAGGRLGQGGWPHLNVA